MFRLHAAAGRQADRTSPCRCPKPRRVVQRSRRRERLLKPNTAVGVDLVLAVELIGAELAPIFAKCPAIVFDSVVLADYASFFG